MVVLDINENLSLCAEYQGNAALQTFNTKTCLYLDLYKTRKQNSIPFDQMLKNKRAAGIVATMKHI